MGMPQPQESQAASTPKPSGAELRVILGAASYTAHSSLGMSVTKKLMSFRGAPAAAADEISPQKKRERKLIIAAIVVAVIFAVSKYVI